MSGPRFLLDTNIVIGLLQGTGAARDLLDARGASPDVCAVSQITRMELLSFPSITEDEEGKIAMLLAAITVLLLDDLVEKEAIQLRRRSRLKLPDAIIAATALVNDLTLLTFDDKLGKVAPN